MTFNLLAPAALGLLALGLGPVIAHFTRQVIREERAFGATLLLARLKTRLERRRRVADRALLALRVAAVLLALLALTRPQLSWPETHSDLGGTGRVLIVLDTSLSMDQRGVALGVGTGSAFEAAREAAIAAALGVPDGTKLAAIRTSPPEVIAGWSAGGAGDGASLAAVLATASRSDAAGDLHSALVLARGLAAGEPAEVVVFTDESGPGQVAACDTDFERILAVGGSVVPRVFAPPEPANIAVRGAVYGDGVEGGAISVDLQNFGADEREVTTTLALPGGESLTSFASVPGASEAGPGAAEVRFTVPRQAQGGIASVSVGDPDLPADNLRFFHLPRIGASRVLVVDGDPGSTPTKSETYFLERALAPVGLGRPAVDVVGPAGIAVLDPAVHRVVWMANVADPAPLVPRLTDFVRKGGGLVIGLGDGVTADRYNTAMEGLLPLPLRKVRDIEDAVSADGASLRVGVPSDLLRPFERSPDAYARVRARRVMTVDASASALPAAVLLQWGDGIPALVERRVGAGDVLLWTSTLDYAWGNFPVEALFPAFVDRVTSVLGGETGQAGDALDGIVGESVAVAVAPDAPELELTGPGGGIRAAERTLGQLQFRPDAAGAWTVLGSEGAPVATVAVNTPPAESDVRHDGSILARQAALAPDKLMVHLDLLPMLAALGGLALFAATCWAAWLARAPEAAGESDTSEVADAQA